MTNISCGKCGKKNGKKDFLGNKQRILDSRFRGNDIINGLALEAFRLLARSSAALSFFVVRLGKQSVKKTDPRLVFLAERA